MVNQELKIPVDYLQKWQKITDTMAELLNVPTGLIMRLVDREIQVLVASRGSENPYKPGEGEIFENSGLYCEHVIKTSRSLLVPNALKSETWKNNPDVKLNMISYLGFPIRLPDDTPFGTICVLDNRENHYSEVFTSIMENLKEIIEADLKMLYMNHVLGSRNKKLIEFISEIKQLRGLLRICARCKRIQNEDGKWVDMENYIENHSEAEFSHGLCDKCAKVLYGDKPWFRNR